MEQQYLLKNKINTVTKTLHLKNIYSTYVHFIIIIDFYCDFQQKEFSFTKF